MPLKQFHRRAYLLGLLLLVVNCGVDIRPNVAGDAFHDAVVDAELVQFRRHRSAQIVRRPAFMAEPLDQPAAASL